MRTDFSATPQISQIDAVNPMFLNLCRTKPADALRMIEGMPEAARAQLALYCNARTHLREIGRAVAKTCSVDALVLEGGQAGQFLYQQAANLSPAKSAISLGGGYRRARPTWQSHRSMY